MKPAFSSSVGRNWTPSGRWVTGLPRWRSGSSYAWPVGTRNWEGPKGLAGYTTERDKDGYFHSFWCYPSGPGARTGSFLDYTYTESKHVAHKSRARARERAWRLFSGEKPVKKAPANRKNLEGYCTKEKKVVKIANPKNVIVKVRKSERNAIRGECPNCGTKIQKFGAVVDCPECGQMAEATKDDYICKACRAKGE